MNSDAQALLRNNRLMQSRRSVIRTKLEKTQALEEQLSDEKIQDMTLKRRPFDGLPIAARHGSRTEYVALHYREQLMTEQRQQDLETMKLKAELVSVEENIALYEAIMRSLYESEVILVRLHYDDGLSFSRIAELDAASGVPGVYSVSTLKRMNANILRKANKVLNPFPVGTHLN